MSPLEKLETLYPSLTKRDLEKALAAGKTLAGAMTHLDSLGVERFVQEFGLSRSTSRDMYAAHAGDIESARKHLDIWIKEEKKNEAKKKRWLKRSPREKAGALLKNSNRFTSYHESVDLGILDEGGARWNSEEWAGLPEYDKKLEWLYTSLLLVATDHAQGFWCLSKAMRNEAIQTLTESGWEDVATELRKAFSNLTPSDCHLAESRFDHSTLKEEHLAKRLREWIIEHAEHLTFFTVWQD